MDLQHGCRAEYGPLELRIQTTSSVNQFMIYVQDPRLEDHSTVHEGSVRSTLQSAKAYLTSQADEYLSSHKQTAEYEATWRCS